MDDDLLNRDVAGGGGRRGSALGMGLAGGQQDGGGGQCAAAECGVMHGNPELNVTADEIHSHSILLSAATTRRRVVTIASRTPTSGSCVGDLRKCAIPLFAIS